MAQKLTDYRKLADNNFIGSWDLDDQMKTVTIMKVHNEKVFNPNSNKEEVCTIIDLKEFNKPMVANKTNKKMIAKVLGTNFVEEWIGQQVYIKPEKVKYKGEWVDAIRVQNQAVKDSAGLICEECGCAITPANKMTDVEVAAYTKEKYGRQLCAACARKANSN